jgi:hypothetical protein
MLSEGTSLEPLQLKVVFKIETILRVRHYSAFPTFDPEKIKVLLRLLTVDFELLEMPEMLLASELTLTKEETLREAIEEGSPNLGNRAEFQVAPRDVPSAAAEMSAPQAVRFTFCFSCL